MALIDSAHSDQYAVQVSILDTAPLIASLPFDPVVVVLMAVSLALTAMTHRQAIRDGLQKLPRRAFTGFVLLFTMCLPILYAGLPSHDAHAAPSGYGIDSAPENLTTLAQGM